MSKKMLIDAAHPEEVRVAVLSQNKIEDFDFESAAKKPLRGNIFLARVTRVEPSLQAAFVDYGGNRHGFLAFSEIHPDYYQIPVSDRQALQKAEEEVAELAAQLELVQRGDEDEDEDPSVEDDGDDQDAAETAAETDSDAEDDDGGDAVSDADQDDPAPTAETTDAEQDDEDAEAPSLDASDADPSSQDGDDATDDNVGRRRDAEEEEEEEEDGEGPGKRDVNVADNDDQKKEDEDARGDVEAASESGADESDDQGDVGGVEASADGDDEADEAYGGEESVAADDSADDADDDRGDDEGDIESDDDAKQDDATRAKREQLFEQYKEAKRKRAQLLRNYKIQEVIKRRQILLIQVVKEERGNKGAALTTYLSLAGRYCVLMPNTARGGGISRKIANGSDRRRLRRVVDSLDVPKGMGLIIRTAGSKRTKTEIKRDYDYLLRMWENIRSLTLKSIAPCLIYEEASLIKRAIRDLYDKDISKVLVEGEDGYREAKDFMKMLMPSHAKNVQPYKDRAPIFLKHGVETQLDGMYQPTVRLKSGGYLVIHQTEALVAIDVNSGRATRERNIEQTALKTNIEAAEEAARQFRLRDLAGLIVIDFIDMEEPRNNRKVEKAIKEAMKSDRARVQIGRISSFGLMEMSRQRRRSGIVDGTTQTCPTCAGAGVIRSHDMAALRILRAVEGEAISGKVGLIAVRTSTDVALHVLNHNRDWLNRIERNNGVSVEVTADPNKAGDDYDLEKSGAPRDRSSTQPVVRADQTEPIEAPEEDDAAVIEEDRDDEDRSARQDDQPPKRRRRRRRGRRDQDESDQQQDASEDDAQNEDRRADGEKDAGEDKPKKRRRRGRRGGRRNRRDEAQEDIAVAETADPDDSDDAGGPQSSDQESPPVAAQEEAPAETVAASDAPSSEPVVETEDTSTVDNAEPVNGGGAAARADDVAEEDAPEAEDDPAPAPEPKKRTRRGWWQRPAS